MSQTQCLTPADEIGYSVAAPETVASCSGADASGWAVIATHPQAEHWAIANLQRMGYQCFLPTLAVLRRDPTLRTLTRCVVAPLFPNYAFVWLDTRDPWGAVRYARGVKRLLMDGTKPGFAPTPIIEALQASEAARQTPTPPHTLRIGAAVKLTHGAFKGLRATITTIRGNHARFVVMMFGGLRELTLPLNALALDDEAAA